MVSISHSYSLQGPYHTSCQSTC